jgi:3-phenylpropionate/cinnamic acid dioxygenase small subunit
MTTERKVHRWVHPTTDGARASLETHLALTVFYAFEAELLDEWQLDEWLSLVDDDFGYRIPVPVITEDIHQCGYDTRSLLMDETRTSIIENWQTRLTDEHNAVSWADSPPIRLHRTVSSIRVRNMDGDGRLLARSKVRLLMVRQSADPKELTAERYDVLRRIGAEDFQIVSRFVTLTEVVLDAPRLRLIF